MTGVIIPAGIFIRVEQKMQWGQQLNFNLESLWEIVFNHLEILCLVAMCITCMCMMPSLYEFMRMYVFLSSLEMHYF